MELICNSNVIVATVDILNSSNKEVVGTLCNHCSHLFIDEAHPISAKNWIAIRERFKKRRVVEFTVTPFRNDGNAIGGKIIYNYTLGEAQKAGYFTQINLIPVEEYYDDNSDISIAKQALATLRNDINDGCDHLLMDRAQTQKRANSIFEIYKKLAQDLNPDWDSVLRRLSENSLIGL